MIVKGFGSLPIPAIVQQTQPALVFEQATVGAVVSVSILIVLMML